MSADNWMECPKCKAEAASERLKNIEFLKQQYGKIPADVYMARMKEAEKMPLIDEEMREDWEIGMDDDGEFSVGYSASCQSCGFTFCFEHSENALKEKA